MAFGFLAAAAEGFLSLVQNPTQFIEKAGRTFAGKSALRLVWPTLRTIGWLGEILEPGLGGRLSAQRRLLAGFRVFSALPSPLFGSFRRGVAYPNLTEVAEGWLPFFIEAFVPGTNARKLSFDMFEAANQGDWVKALDHLTDVIAEIKLEDALAFMRGITQIGKDLETVFGRDGAFTALSAILADVLLKLSSGELVDLGDIVDYLEGFQKGEDEEGPPPGPPEAPEFPEVVIPVRRPIEGGEPPPPFPTLKTPEKEAEFRRLTGEKEEELTDFEVRIVSLLAQAFRRVSGGVRWTQEIVGVIKKGATAFEKVLAVVIRALG